MQASNKHYGRPANLIAAGRAAQMNEGWETARNPRRPAVLEVDAQGQIVLSDDQVPSPSPPASRPNWSNGVW